MGNLKVIGAAVLALAIIVGVVYGVWQMKRAWNYSWGYESQVIETVCGMVKPEYLIDPTKCNK